MNKEKKEQFSAKALSEYAKVSLIDEIYLLEKEEQQKLLEQKENTNKNKGETENKNTKTKSQNKKNTSKSHKNITKEDVIKKLKLKYYLAIKNTTINELTQDLLPEDFRTNTRLRLQESLKPSGTISNYIYGDFCNRLQIKEEITLNELLLIHNWKTEIIQKELYSQTKDTNEKREEKQKIVNNTPSELIQISKLSSYFVEIYPKIEFIENLVKFSKRTLLFWNNYAAFFDDTFKNDLVFLEVYANLNELGKKVIHEIMLQLLEEDELEYQDNQIQLYKKMQNQILLTTNEKTKKALAESISQKWKYYYDYEDLKNLEYLTNIALQNTKEDWECLITYHRINILGKDLKIEDLTYLQYANNIIDLISNIPALTKETQK